MDRFNTLPENYRLRPVLHFTEVGLGRTTCGIEFQSFRPDNPEFNLIPSGVTCPDCLAIMDEDAASEDADRRLQARKEGD